MILSNVFSSHVINIDLESDDKDEVFEELVENFVAGVPELNRSDVLSALLEREEMLSTGIGNYVAVPHGVCSGFSGVKGLIAISKKGIDFDSVDDLPVHLFFVLISGENDCEYHLQVIKRIAEILKEPYFVKTILSKTTPQDVFDTLIRFEETVTSTT